MNGQTAKIINKAAQNYRMNSRRLKRAYNKLNHIERGQAKADMFSFCMGLKKAAANQAEKVRKGTKAKVSSDKVKSDKVSRSKATKSKINNQKSPILRRIIAWVMLKLGIWNWETSYKYGRKSKINNHQSNAN